VVDYESRSCPKIHLGKSEYRVRGHPKRRTKPYKENASIMALFKYSASILSARTRLSDYQSSMTALYPDRGVSFVLGNEAISYSSGEHFLT